MARFKLTKTVPSLSTKHDIRVWTITVTCTALATGGDGNVFVYQSATEYPTDTDLFYGVADSRDMSVIPIEGNEANSDLTDTAGAQYDNVPFYRVNTATFDCNNACEVNRIWERIKLEVQNLSWELDAINATTWTETESEEL